MLIGRGLRTVGYPVLKLCRPAFFFRRAQLLRLNSIGAGSRLYAVFNNGIAYQFIHGKIIDQNLVKEYILVWLTL